MVQPEVNSAEREKHTALVVEGGAMRGIFSSGVLDSFIADGFNPFGMCIGVSAGANNLLSFCAGKEKRNYTIYTEISTRPEFINVRRFLAGGHLFDIDWLWERSICELPLDMERVVESEQEYLIGLTRVSDAQAVYAKPDKDNLGTMLKASSAMPLFYRSFVPVPGVDDADDSDDSGTSLFVDGGLADPIPVVEAYRRGATRILVIRSRPYSFRMSPRRSYRLMWWALQDYPKLLECLQSRPDRYNETIDFIRTPPAGVEILEVNPPDEFETSRMTRDTAALERDYKRGLERGTSAMNQWASVFA